MLCYSSKKQGLTLISIQKLKQFWKDAKSISNEDYLQLINERMATPIKDINFVSLFAGGGGSSIGYRMAGFNEVLAVEMNKFAVSTLKANAIPVYHGDVWDFDQILERIGDTRIDWLDASPPCQSFSSLNREKHVNDDRNYLYQAPLQLAEIIKPKVVLIENVVGFLKNKDIQNSIDEWAKRNGYFIHKEFIVSAGYLVPQYRRRSFILLSKQEIINPFPDPYPYFISPEEAIKGADTRDGKEISELIRKDYHRVKVHYGEVNDGKWFSVRKLRRHSPNPAFTASLQGSVSTLHFDEPRNLSIGEFKRLFSFPDSHDIKGSVYKHKYRQLGNSVPPFVIAEIAGSVSKKIWN